MSRSTQPALVVDGVNLNTAPMPDVVALLTPIERVLATALMRDHGCILHVGPDSGPCRACHRRVLIVRAWLTEDVGSPLLR